jgi:spermidine synthase
MITHPLSRRLFLIVVLASFLAVPALAQRNGAIYEVKSPFQTITVWDSPDGASRQMLFDATWDGNDAIQSEMDKRNPNRLVLDYAQYMIASLPVVDKPKRILVVGLGVLVVGLGGACIQRYVRNLLPDLIIETAELDPAVEDVAKRYFNLVEGDHQIVHIGDGRKFIEQSKDKYDIIMLDAFSATSIPYMLATQEFLKAVKEHLADGGIVCANLWSHQKDYADMLKTYDTLFAEMHVLPCPAPWTNHILVAMPAKQDLTVDKWKEKATAFDKGHPTGLKLTDFIGRHIAPATLISPGAKVLLDKDAPKD